jgi:hypothetical protein
MPKKKIGFDVPGPKGLECPVCFKSAKVSGVCDRCVDKIEANIRLEFNLPKEQW